MKLPFQLSPVTRRPPAGFTLIELAVCLAVIGFGLVAIIGVLPTGMRVQKDNREETLINQDAALLMEAVRVGYNIPTGTNVAGLNLTNFFDRITVGGTNYAHGAGFTTAAHIVGLISIPLLGPITNANVSWVRSLSGVRGDMGLATRTNTFAYELTTEILPSFSTVNLPAPANKLWDVRLTFRWPLIPGVGVVGQSHKSFRTQMMADLYTNAAGYVFLDTQTLNP